MTRKDYKLIAAVLDGSLIVWPSAMAAACREQRDAYACALADRLAADNTRFDRARFLAACGVKPQQSWGASVLADGPSSDVQS